MGEKLRILDAFSGSGNWVKPWWKSVSYNIEIDSIDIQKLPHINHCMDIRKFIFDKEYHIAYFSPPCTHFSKIRECNTKVKTSKEEMKEAIELVDLSFNLAKKAKLCYVIENPYTGLLPKLYSGSKRVDYSEYGYPMKKSTSIWSNLPLNLKIQKEIKYNRLPLSSMGKIERSMVPLELSEYVKRIIIRTYNKELQQFKKVFDGKPGFKRF